jgi:hypothetical protein
MMSIHQIKTMPAQKMTAELEETFFSFVLSDDLLPLLFFTLFPDDALPSDQRKKCRLLFRRTIFKNESAT